MENIEDRSKLQSSLFEGSRPNRLYFITTQRNLMSFLGSGMIMPAGSQFRYKVDTREAFGGSIPFWKGGIPDVEEYAGLLNDERVVVIEYELDDVTKYGGRHKLVETEQLMVVNAPVPLWCVSSINMHSTSAIDDFVMRLPDDVIAERDIFGVIPDIQKLLDQPKPEFSLPDDIEPQLAFIDAFGGGVKALQHFPVNEISDHSYVMDLLPVCLASNGIKPVSSECATVIGHKSRLSESDRLILSKLFPALIDIKPEDGFDPIDFLSRLQVSITSSAVTVAEDIGKWFVYVRKVLEAEAEVPELADAGDIYKRAVMLFLLRPDLDRLMASAESSISPGPTVLSIAAFLVGYANGIGRLGQEYKGNYRAYSKFSKLLLDSFWCKSKYTLSATRETPTNYRASLIFEIGNEPLLELVVEQDVTLARVLSQARSVGYELTYDYDNDELHYTYELEAGRTQVVYIEKLKPLADGFDVIRFVSPCFDLSGTKMKTLTKAKAIDFLSRNSDDSMYCSFAYSERRSAIVVESTQIVKTMDDGEFVMLLNYVAKVADEYERDVLGKDEY